MAGSNLKTVFFVLFSLLMVGAILVVLLPGLVSGFSSTFFLVTADLSALKPGLVAQLHVDAATAQALISGEYVSAGLWNSCALRGGVYSCRAPSFTFVFDPAALWSADGSDASASLILPPRLVSELDSHSIATSYVKVLAFVSIGLGLVAAVAGSIGSCVAQRRRTVPAGLAMACVLVAVLLMLVDAALIVRNYTSLLDSLDTAFSALVSFSLGRAALAFLWSSVLFGLVAGVLGVMVWRDEQLHQRRKVARPRVVSHGNMWQSHAYSRVSEGDPAAETAQDTHIQDPSEHALLQKEGR